LAMLTCGVSLLGNAIFIVESVNAGMKLDIINAEMRSRGTYSHTRELM